MKSRKTVQDKLYIPLKEKNGILEYMFDPRGRFKSYRSEESLEEYCPDYDKIAVYKLDNIKNISKSGVKTRECS